MEASWSRGFTRKSRSTNVPQHIHKREGRHLRCDLAELDRFWEKEQTKADVEVFILDEVFAKLPTPPFTAEEKKAVAGNVYAHVWQQAMNGELAKAA